MYSTIITLLWSLGPLLNPLQYFDYTPLDLQTQKRHSRIEIKIQLADNAINKLEQVFDYYKTMQI